MKEKVNSNLKTATVNGKFDDITITNKIKQIEKDLISGYSHKRGELFFSGDSEVFEDFVKYELGEIINNSTPEQRIKLGVGKILSANVLDQISFLTGGIYEEEVKSHGESAKESAESILDLKKGLTKSEQEQYGFNLLQEVVNLRYYDMAPKLEAIYNKIPVYEKANNLKSTKRD